MKRPLISVLLPVHNGAKTLGEAIASLQSQTLENWEAVVVDDGSNDGTLDLLHDTARGDGRIRVEAMPRGGIVAALRRAAELAEGRWLARMDADDISLPHRFEEQVALVERTGAGFAGGRVRIFGERIGSGRRRYEEWINALVTHDEIVREIFVECPLPHPTFFLKREVYDALGGYQDFGWPEDYDLVLRAWRAGVVFAKTECPVLEWREHPRRLSMRDNRYNEHSFRAAKRYYISDIITKSHKTIYQWGAGEVGKQWLKEWNDWRPEAVVDINPRKIGRMIHGYRVITPEQLPPPGRAFVLVTVGTPGAREDIRATCAALGYEECRDYLFLA